MASGEGQTDNTVPDLLDRLIDGREAEANNLLITPHRSFDRRGLIARVSGATQFLRGKRRVTLSFTEAACWVPWLLGAAMTGTCVEPDEGGITTLADESVAHLPLCGSADEPWLVVKTSGSTGLAKTFVRSRSSWLRCFVTEADLLELKREDRFLVVGDGSFSLVQYAVVRALYLGACTVVLPMLSAHVTKSLFNRASPSVIYAAPPLLVVLAKRVRQLEAVKDVRLVITGGTRLSLGQLELVSSVFSNARIVTFYGAAETSFIAFKNAPSPCEEDDMGALFPGVDARTDGLGRLCICSPYLVQGRAMKGGIVQPIADRYGWVHLADLGYVDARRHVWLKGRVDGVIDVRGTLTSPDCVERILEQEPWIGEAVLVPDVSGDRTRLVSVLVPMALVPADAAQRLRERCKGVHARLRPRRFLLMRRPPRTASGKIDRVGLGEAIQRGWGDVQELN